MQKIFRYLSGERTTEIVYKLPESQCTIKIHKVNIDDALRFHAIYNFLKQPLPCVISTSNVTRSVAAGFG